jgi:tetratricopeptide (TPR) repeat protein
VQEIGTEFNIATVLEGSVQRSGNRVRIGAHLINTSDNEQLWAETYDRELTDVFQIQSQIAEQIADALKLKLRLGTAQRNKHELTENLEAYDLYLRGRYNWNKRLPDNLRKSIQYFEDALSKDPGYAKAYAGLADSYIILGDFNILPPEETYSKARNSATKALDLDTENAEAHTSLAYAIMHYDRDWPAAEREFHRAIELSPNSAQAHSWYALYLSVMNRSEEAIAESQRARALDPYSASILTDAGLTLYLSRKYDAAIELFQEALKIDPTFIVANVPLGGTYIQKHMDSTAIALFQQLTMASAFVNSKANPVPIAALAYVFGISNRKDDALMYIELLQEKSREEYVSPYWMGVAYVGVGNTDEAFKWLEKAYSERDGSLIFIRAEPIFDKLHSDPRYLKLINELGLPD